MSAMYLGIDAAKSKFDAVLLIEEAKPKHKVFANTDLVSYRWRSRPCAGMLACSIQQRGPVIDYLSAPPRRRSLWGCTGCSLGTTLRQQAR